MMLWGVRIVRSGMWVWGVRMRIWSWIWMRCLGRVMRRGLRGIVLGREGRIRKRKGGRRVRRRIVIWRVWDWM